MASTDDEKAAGKSGGDEPDFDDDDIELIDSIWAEIGESEGEPDDE